MFFLLRGVGGASFLLKNPYNFECYINWPFLFIELHLFKTQPIHVDSYFVFYSGCVFHDSPLYLETSRKRTDDFFFATK